MSSIDSYGDLVDDAGNVMATADAIASGNVDPGTAAEVMYAGGGAALGGPYVDPVLSTGPFMMQDPSLALPAEMAPNLGYYPYTAVPGAIQTTPTTPTWIPPSLQGGAWQQVGNPQAAATPGTTPAAGAAPAAALGSNAAFSQVPATSPINLTGPLSQTPFGQVAGQVLGRGYLPAFNFLQLMVEAEMKRVAAEQQQLTDEAAIAMNQGNLNLAISKSNAANALALRGQELAEQMERGQLEITRQNAATQRDVAGRGMTLQEQTGATQREIAGRGMTLQEKVDPYAAQTARMTGMAPLATSPLVNWYTARGEAPPQIIADLLRNAVLAPGETPAVQAQSAAPDLIQPTWIRPPGLPEGRMRAMSASPQAPAAPTSEVSKPYQQPPTSEVSKPYQQPPTMETSPQPRGRVLNIPLQYEVQPPLGQTPIGQSQPATWAGPAGVAGSQQPPAAPSPAAGVWGGVAGLAAQKKDLTDALAKAELAGPYEGKEANIARLRQRLAAIEQQLAGVAGSQQPPAAPSPAAGLLSSASGGTLEGLKAAFGTVRGDPRYREEYDLNGDGRISVSDYSAWTAQPPAPAVQPQAPRAPSLDATMNLLSATSSAAPLTTAQPPVPQGALSTGAAPFMRSLAAGTTLPPFTGRVGPYAPPLPGAAQWSSMTPSERTGTQELFKSFGTPPEDFLAMLEKSLPPGGSPATMANAARFVGAVR